jgi:hypothetical protein
MRVVQRIAKLDVIDIFKSRRSVAHMEVLSERLSILQIITTSVLIAICYFTIGLQLAVVPRFVHCGLATA